MVEKNTKKRKAKKALSLKLKNLAILFFLTYAIVVLISQQNSISEKKKQNQAIKQQLEMAQQENDEFYRLLSMSDNDEFMERIAIEKLGYAYPNEIRVFDTSRK